MSLEQDVLINEIKIKVEKAIDDPTYYHILRRYEIDDGQIIQLHFTFHKEVPESLVIACHKIYKDRYTEAVGKDIISLDYGKKFITHFATSIIFKRIALIRKEIRKAVNAAKQMQNVMHNKEVRSLESTDTTDSNSEKDDRCRDTKATC